jgi:hypothetical protein
LTIEPIGEIEGINLDGPELSSSFDDFQLYEEPGYRGFPPPRKYTSTNKLVVGN